MRATLSNLGAYSEPCQTLFITLIVKDSILDVWQGSEYASVICYSLFGKIGNTNKIDSVEIEIYSF